MPATSFLNFSRPGPDDQGVALNALSFITSRLPTDGVSIALWVIAAPFVLALGVALSYLLKALWRMMALNVLGIDTYGHIPRPKHQSKWWELPILGDLPKIRDEPPGVAHRAWIKETGSNVLVYRMLFYASRLLIVDTAAIVNILSAQNSYAFPKPRQAQHFLERILGRGLIVVEGDVHKRQRKILQPAFNISAIRDLTPGFFKHANRLAERIGGLVDGEEGVGPSDTPFVEGQTALSAQASTKGKLVVDVSYWLSRTTLDIIGDAGFDWHFNSIQKKQGDESDEVAEAFKCMTRIQPSVTQFLSYYIKAQPGLGWMRHVFKTKREKEVDESFKVLVATSKKIINDKRQAILREMQQISGDEKKQALSKADWEVSGQGATGEKDLLFLMMRSNMSSDIRESERLSDAELLAQMTTLMLAGHETTATLLTWTLYQLADDQAIQNKLRAELTEYFAGRDSLPFDELSAIPYLDAVIKETLRFNSPVPSTIRVCEQDYVVPLSRSYPTQDGKGSFNNILLRKGDEVFVPIYIINTSEELWGPTALKYDPERWFDVPKAAKESGLPLHILSFLAGPRGCIGSRFSIAESKALLAMLILNFKFERVPGWEIETKQGVVMRPRVIGQEDAGLQMPLAISRL